MHFKCAQVKGDSAGLLHRLFLMLSLLHSQMMSSAYGESTLISSPSWLFDFGMHGISSRSDYPGMLLTSTDRESQQKYWLIRIKLQREREVLSFQETQEVSHADSQARDPSTAGYPCAGKDI